MGSGLNILFKFLPVLEFGGPLKGDYVEEIHVILGPGMQGFLPFFLRQDSLCFLAEIRVHVSTRERKLMERVKIKAHDSCLHLALDQKELKENVRWRQSPFRTGNLKRKCLSGATQQREVSNFPSDGEGLGSSHCFLF